jgi:leader peptidase (prepilin peptidase)/N-methyltransferase
LFGWLLLALAAIDLRAYLLPNGLTATLAIAGLALGRMPLDARLIGGALGFAALWLVAASYHRLRGRVGLGGGDPKMFGAIGCWLGWQALPTVLLAACVIGLSIVLERVLSGREVSGGMRLPFGALLAPAAFAVWLGMALRFTPV